MTSTYFDSSDPLLAEGDLIALDTETGGTYPATDSLLSVAVVPSWGSPATTIYFLPEPEKKIEAAGARVNGYTPELWAARGAVPLRRGLLMLGVALETLLAEKKGARMLAHNAGFDRSFLEEACRPFDITLPGRHAWECSMAEFSSTIRDGLIPDGSRSLARLGELAGLWPVGERPATHDATEDACACLAGYLWLRKKKRDARHAPTPS